MWCLSGRWLGAWRDGVCSEYFRFFLCSITAFGASVAALPQCSAVQCPHPPTHRFPNGRSRTPTRTRVPVVLLGFRFGPSGTDRALGVSARRKGALLCSATTEAIPPTLRTVGLALGAEMGQVLRSPVLLQLPPVFRLLRGLCAYLLCPLSPKVGLPAEGTDVRTIMPQTAANVYRCGSMRKFVISTFPRSLISIRPTTSPPPPLSLQPPTVYSDRSTADSGCRHWRWTTPSSRAHHHRWRSPIAVNPR